MSQYGTHPEYEKGYDAGYSEAAKRYRPKPGKLALWAKNLDENQLLACLNELRGRNMAIAVYDVNAIVECFGVEETPEMRQWMDDNRDELEEAMCETARQIILENCPGIDWIDTK